MIKHIPKYEHGSAQLIDCGDGTEMILVSNTDIEHFSAYLEALLDNGYCSYCAARQVNGNIFRTLVNGETYIYMYFTAYTGTLRLIVGHTDFLPYIDKPGKTVCEPMLLGVGQSEHTNCGQGYIFRLSDGRLLVHDGGSRYDDCPDYMYESIKRVALDPEHITIAAWFISHPHTDHQSGFEEFLENHATDEGIRIENVVYTYGPSEIYRFKREDGIAEACDADADRMRSTVETYLPRTRIIKAHTGQMMRFGDATGEVMYTVEDFYPNTLDFVNSASMVIRVHIGGKSVMLLADTTHKSGRVLENMYGEALRSDMVQIAHHGMWAGHSSLYDTIAAPVILWPDTQREVDKWKEDKAVRTAMKYAKDVYVSGSKGVEVAL